MRASIHATSKQNSESKETARGESTSRKPSPKTVIKGSQGTGGIKPPIDSLYLLNGQNSKSNNSKNNVVDAARARRNEAKSVAKTMLLAIKNYDKKAFLNVHRKSMRRDYKEIFRKKSWFMTS